MMCIRARSEHHKSIKYNNGIKDLIKRINFLNATMEGDRNLFTEIRKIMHIVKLYLLPLTESKVM